MIDLKPVQHLCGKCLGTAYTTALCTTCDTGLTIKPVDHFAHEGHDLRLIPCFACSGTGTLEAQLRRRFLPREAWQDYNAIRIEARARLAEFMGRQADKIITESMCSTSMVESSTSAPSTTKRRGGRTTP